MQVATKTHAELLPTKGTKPIASREEGSEPLFSKDTVYHAGVCSLAVNTCDAGNYQSFFKKKEMVPGHSFQAVSISRSKQDRYLIARQGDSTLYFAFQSEPKLLNWKQYKSFSEGMQPVQCVTAC